MLVRAVLIGFVATAAEKNGTGFIRRSVRSVYMKWETAKISYLIIIIIIIII